MISYCYISRTNSIFLCQFIEQFCCVASAILYGRWQPEVVSATGKNAAAAIFAEEEKLHHHLFSGMLPRQTLPPGETSDAEQLCTVKHDVGSSNPGNLVAHHLSWT